MRRAGSDRRAGAPNARPARWLRSGDVVVHWIDLDRPPGAAGDRPPTGAAEAVLAAALSGEERRHAARLRSARDRRRFIAAHARLRAILSRYGAGRPADIRLERGAHGKPALAGGGRLRFNLSHSHGVGVVAVAYDREVGVDVERVRADRALRDVARAFFSRSEVAALEQVGEAELAAVFYRCWTRKEAYVKGRGLGMSLPLDSFDVSLAVRPPSALLATRPDPRHAARWRVLDVSLSPDYPAALAVQRGARRVRCVGPR
jgi:4'-phosphopantetheinyl transferase